MATGVGQLLKRQADPRFNPAVIEQFNLRMRAWWLMCSRAGRGLLARPDRHGRLVRPAVVLGVARVHHAHSHAASPTIGRCSGSSLFTPLQYVLVGMDKYALYSIVIPVYAFLFIPVRMAMAGDYKRYLERCAKIQPG